MMDMLKYNKSIIINTRMKNRNRIIHNYYSHDFILYDIILNILIINNILGQTT